MSLLKAGSLITDNLQEAPVEDLAQRELCRKGNQGGKTSKVMGAFADWVGAVGGMTSFLTGGLGRDTGTA